MRFCALFLSDIGAAGQASRRGIYRLPTSGERCEERSTCKASARCCCNKDTCTLWVGRRSTDQDEALAETLVVMRGVRSDCTNCLHGSCKARQHVFEKKPQQNNSNRAITNRIILQNYNNDQNQGTATLLPGPCLCWTSDSYPKAWAQAGRQRVEWHKPAQTQENNSVTSSHRAGVKTRRKLNSQQQLGARMLTSCEYAA